MQRMPNEDEMRGRILSGERSRTQGLTKDQRAKTINEIVVLDKEKNTGDQNTKPNSEFRVEK